MSDRDGYRQRVITVRGRARAQLQAMRKERLARKRKPLVGHDGWPMTAQPAPAGAGASEVRDLPAPDGGIRADPDAAALAEDAVADSSGIAPTADDDSEAGTGAPDQPIVPAPEGDVTVGPDADDLDPHADTTFALQGDDADAPAAEGAPPDGVEAETVAPDDPQMPAPEVAFAGPDAEVLDRDGAAAPALQESDAVAAAPEGASPEGSLAETQPVEVADPAGPADLTEPRADAAQESSESPETAPAAEAAPSDPDHAAKQPATPGPVETRRTDETDLFEIPGIGSGLVWMLRSEGVTSLAELACSDAGELGRRLGVVSRLLDLDDLVRFARANQGRPDPSGRADATAP